MADQQRLSGADDMFGEPIGRLTMALGQYDALLDFQLKANFVAFLKSDVEVAGVKNLPQFFLNGAQDLILVETRTDGLADFGEQFVFLRTALGVVHHDVIFQRQADLQR